MEEKERERETERELRNLRLTYELHTLYEDNYLGLRGVLFCNLTLNSALIQTYCSVYVINFKKAIKHLQQQKNTAYKIYTLKV